MELLFSSLSDGVEVATAGVPAMKGKPGEGPGVTEGPLCMALDEAAELKSIPLISEKMEEDSGGCFLPFTFASKAVLRPF